MVIWVHGTLEILAFVIASTAGFVIAQGILFQVPIQEWFLLKAVSKTL